MTRYVALLRGINVGGHRVKMDRLRSLFEELGHTDVATFIASGNVVFSSTTDDVDALRESIEAHLLDALGFEVPTMIRTPGELEAVSAVGAGVDAVSEDGGSVYVVFTREPVEPSVRSALEDLESDTDRFEFHGREIYWILRGKMSESPLFGGAVTKALASVPHTARNLTSLRKLLAKHGGG